MNFFDGEIKFKCQYKIPEFLRLCLFFFYDVKFASIRSFGIFPVYIFSREVINL